jgi:Ser/Thr protein kinase RdoA (MazF antagonist)
MLISERQIAQLLAPLALEGPLVIEEIKQHNHVYRIVAGAEAFFLKTYTKDWYGDNIAGTAGCVQHERAAWAVLAAHGLSTPQLVLAEAGCDNPAGRPVVLTRALAGEALGKNAPARVVEQLHAVGDYLRRMHAITFDAVGYLMPGGPDPDPAGNGWQHPLWDAHVWQHSALARFENERALLPPELASRVAALLERSAALLAPAYATPRYTHGDCWPHQFFVHERPERVEDAGWAVTGVLDMEVVSAGDAEADFVHLLIELAALLPAAMGWWQTLFAGYAGTPDFERFRLRLLATTLAEFRGMWPGDLSHIRAHTLAASDWQSLLDVERVLNAAVQ